MKLKKCVVTKGKGFRLKDHDPASHVGLHSKDEARTAAKESREDVLSGIRAIEESLRGQNILQQSHFAGVTTQLKEFSDSSRMATDGLRLTLVT